MERILARRGTWPVLLPHDKNPSCELMRHRGPLVSPLYPCVMVPCSVLCEVPPCSEERERGVCFVRNSDPRFVEVDSLAPPAPTRDVSFLALEEKTSGNACGRAPFLPSLLLHTRPPLPPGTCSSSVKLQMRRRRR